MPSRVWSHLCDYATVDGSGKPTIVGDFDNINVPNLPIQFPLFFVISKWNGYGGENFTHRVRVIAPSGQEIATSSQMNITIQAALNHEGNHINVDSFMMLTFYEFGEHAIEIMLNENPVNILPLSVNQKP